MKDTFNIKMLYETNKTGDNWFDNWQEPRTLTKVQVDPDEKIAKMRGSGSLAMKNGIMTMTGSPRYYIHQYHKNVEFTSYFKLNGWSDMKSYSGFTLVSRSNHHLYKEDPCAARSYYCRLWNNGEIGFQQEFRHGSDGTSYSSSKRTNLYDGGIPKDKWIGMKFCILNKGGETILQVYVDETEGKNGGNWKLSHEVNAMIFTKPDPCNGPKPIPDGNVNFIRTDGADTVQVKWASLREVYPQKEEEDDEEEDDEEEDDSNKKLLWLLMIIPTVLIIIGISIFIYLRKKVLFKMIK